MATRDGPACLWGDPNLEVFMTQPVLVVYATKRESTHDVAEAVAARLRERGYAVDVQPAAEAGNLEPYGAVVIGGALYMGRWHHDARHFLSSHREALASLPVAVFAMGPRTTEATDMEESRKQLDTALAKQPELEPISIAVFGGVIDPAKLRFPFSTMGATDARDWDTIRSWADSVAELVTARAAAA
jgi:menaquinone-dependent protoporphyrinogen oxidase